MNRHEAERLLISVVIAAALFGAAAVALHFIDIPVPEYPDYKGPVFITIEEDPRLLSLSPEPVERPEPEKTAKPAERPSGRQTEPERVAEPSRPSETEEAAPKETRPGRVEEQPAEEVATAGVDTGTAETEPLPSGAEEETRPVEETDPERDAPGVEGRETPEEEDEAEEESILGDLSGLDSAMSESVAASDTEDGGAPGEGVGNGETATDLGTVENPVDFDTLTGTRKPLNTPKPKIDSDLLLGLPNEFQVVISFTLLPSGHITGLNFIKDSGNTEVDSIIQNTIRKWRFEPVSEEAGSIQVVAKYNIRVR